MKAVKIIATFTFLGRAQLFNGVEAVRVSPQKNQISQGSGCEPTGFAFCYPYKFSVQRITIFLSR